MSASPSKAQDGLWRAIEVDPRDFGFEDEDGEILEYPGHDYTLRQVKDSLDAGANPIIPRRLYNGDHTPLTYIISELELKEFDVLDILRVMVKDGFRKRQTYDASSSAEKEALLDAKKQAKELMHRTGIGCYGSEECRKLHDIILFLDDSIEDMSEQRTDPLARKILFEEKFSDVKFICSGGEIVSAHKVVLAANCPDYFEKSFSERWDTNTDAADNPGAVVEFHPDCSELVMKAIVSFVYTGTRDNAVEALKENPDCCTELLRAADHYQLSPLKSFLSRHMQRNLSLATIKDSLIAAHLHSLQDLKAVCFKYVQANACRLLFQRCFLELRDDYSDLWAEMASNFGCKEESYGD